MKFRGQCYKVRRSNLYDVAEIIIIFKDQFTFCKMEIIKAIMSLNMNDDDENQRLLDQLLPRMIPRSIYCKSIKPLPITRLVQCSM